MNNEEKQKLKNFMIYKVYLTDKELEESGPFAFLMLAIIIIGGLIWWALS